MTPDDLKEYDVVIVGAGPAGLQAAVHAARRKASVLVLGRAGKSAAWRAHVENLAGFAAATGEDLVTRAVEQARASGAELAEQDAVALSPAGSGTGFAVALESGAKVAARALVLATGVARAKLNVPGEKDLLGKGVSHCVDCDAGFFRGVPVAVVGDGSAAAEGALVMLKHASEVHLVSAGLDVSDALRRAVEESAVVRHVPALAARIVASAEGSAVEALEIEGGERLAVRGVFVELGAKGVLGLASGLGVELDPESMRHVVTDRAQRTNVAGVYAAGDVTGPPFQIAKALGEGCVAGLGAAEHARNARAVAGSSGATGR